MKRLHVVVVNLKRRVSSASRESDDMIIVVADFHSNLAQRQIVRSHIKHSKNVSLDLCARGVEKKVFEKLEFPIEKMIDEAKHHRWERRQLLEVMRRTILHNHD